MIHLHILPYIFCVVIIEVRAAGGFPFGFVEIPGIQNESASAK